MPVRAIPLVIDEFYHVYNRGINKQPIFTSKKDYQRALESFRYYQFSASKLRFSKFTQLPSEEKDKYWSKIKIDKNMFVNVVCYCFMPNHFHFLIRQRLDQGISTFMRKFQDSYTRYFNTIHNGIGPILQGPFKAVRVEDDEQLIHLSRYIHLNPYSSFIVKDLIDLEEYLWSSFPEYLKKSNDNLWSKGIVLSNFKDLEDYKTFIFDRSDYQRKLDKIKHLLLE